METGYLLGVDGGQTATRALLSRIDGTILGSGQAGPIRHVFSGDGEETRIALRDAILAAFADARLEPGGVASSALGITGVQPGEPECEKIAAMVREVIAAERIAVVPDYVTNLESVSPGGTGVVVVAGGGAVAYGRTEDGREAVAGGFGYLLGDEGGGYDIGRQAIAAAIRASDGRDPPTALAESVRDAFGVRDLREIKRVVYAPDFSRDRIAALVPGVARAARAGDAVAGRILTDAGRELARAALAVIARLFDPADSVAVYATGGVFNAGELLNRTFRAAIQEEHPTAQVRHTRAEPVVGALILARRRSNFPVDAEWVEGVRLGSTRTQHRTAPVTSSDDPSLLRR